MSALSLPRHPVLRGSAAAFGAGAAAASLYPIGIHADGTTSGLAGGASIGLAASLCLLPVVALAAVVVLIGFDEESGIAREYRLAGISDRRRWAATWARALRVTAGAAVAGPLTGALVGLGDALRQGGTLTGEVFIPVHGLLLCALAALYLTLLGVALVVSMRNGTQAGIVVAATVTTFVGLLRLFPPGSGGRALIELLPFSPLWATLFSRGRSDYTLPMAASQRVGIALVYTLIAVAAIVLADARARR